MRTALRNSMICVLAASMAGMLTACHIAKATIDMIIRFVSGTSPDQYKLLTKTTALNLKRFSAQNRALSLKHR